MTKKSAARIARDQYRKNNTAWSDIEALYQNNAALLQEITRQVSQFFQIEGVAAFLPQDHRASTIQAIRTLDQDVRVFQSDLEKIHAAHAGKTGRLNPDEDLTQVIELSEAYVKHEMQVDAIINPVYKYLLSIMQQVETAANAAATKVPAASEPVNA